LKDTEVEPVRLARYYSSILLLKKKQTNKTITVADNYTHRKSVSESQLRF